MTKPVKKWLKAALAPAVITAAVGALGKFYLDARLDALREETRQESAATQAVLASLREVYLATVPILTGFDAVGNAARKKGQPDFQEALAASFQTLNAGIKGLVDAEVKNALALDPTIQGAYRSVPKAWHVVVESNDRMGKAAESSPERSQAEADRKAAIVELRRSVDQLRAAIEVRYKALAHIEVGAHD